jgi:hypothetical protein|tara:strand:+ start:7525 stop:7848 length:324 start_codon:yes stop_codon:yes gene_type:complete
MNRYQGIKELRNTNPIAGPLRARYYRNVRYPEIPESPSDVWVITEWGDRLDILADTFYSDVTMYWIIAIANPNYIKFDSLYIKEGTQIRIPVDVNGILRSYKKLNKE